MKSSKLALAIVLLASCAFGAPMESTQGSVMLPAPARAALTRLPTVMAAGGVDFREMSRLETLSARMAVAGAPVSRADLAEYAHLSAAIGDKLVAARANSATMAALYAGARDAMAPYLAPADADLMQRAAARVLEDHASLTVAHAASLAKKLTAEPKDDAVEALPAPPIRSEFVRQHSYLRSSGQAGGEGHDRRVDVPAHTRYFAVIDRQAVRVGGADWIKARIKAAGRELWLTPDGVSELVQMGEDLVETPVLALKGAKLAESSPTVASIPSRVSAVLMKLEAEGKSYWITNAGPYEVAAAKNSETGYALKRVNADGSRFSRAKESAPYAAVVTMMGGPALFAMSTSPKFLLIGGVLAAAGAFALLSLFGVVTTIVQRAAAAMAQTNEARRLRDANWAVLRSYYQRQSQLSWAETKSLLSDLKAGPSNYAVVKERILSRSLRRAAGLSLPADAAVGQALEIARLFPSASETNFAILEFFYREKSRLDAAQVRALLDGLRPEGSNAGMVRERILK